MAAADPDPPRPRYRWVVCAFLFAATTSNYADRQVLALLKPALDHALHWTNREYGAINAAFQVSYAVGTLFFGWLMDRVGAKRGLLTSAFLSSIAALCHATVNSVGGFAMARFALGFGAGGNFPGAVKTVATWFEPHERALATTLFNAGANVAAVLTPILVPLLVLTFGWRSTFLIAGSIGLSWVAAWGFGYRERDGRPNRTDDSGAADAAFTWSGLLRRRETWAFVIPKCLTDPVWGLLLIWLPDFFKKTHGRGLSESWPQLAAIYSIVTVASVAGGWLPEHLSHRGWPVRKARQAALLVSAVFALPIIGAGFGGAWTAVLLIGITGAAHQSWSANLFTVASDLFPERAVASVVGLGGLISALGVSVFSVLSGELLDHYQALGRESQGYRVLFILFALTYTAAWAVHVLVLRMSAGPVAASPGGNQP